MKKWLTVGTWVVPFMKFSCVGTAIVTCYCSTSGNKLSNMGKTPIVKSVVTFKAYLDRKEYLKPHGFVWGQDGKIHCTLCVKKSFSSTYKMYRHATGCKSHITAYEEKNGMLSPAIRQRKAAVKVGMRKKLIDGEGGLNNLKYEVRYILLMYTLYY